MARCVRAIVRAISSKNAKDMLECENVTSSMERIHLGSRMIRRSEQMGDCRPELGTRTNFFIYLHFLRYSATATIRQSRAWLPTVYTGRGDMRNIPQQYRFGVPPTLGKAMARVRFTQDFRWSSDLKPQASSLEASRFGAVIASGFDYDPILRLSRSAAYFPHLVARTGNGRCPPARWRTGSSSAQGDQLRRRVRLVQWWPAALPR